MNYFLDSSVIIELLRQKQYAWDFLDQHNRENILTSTVCEAEAWEGIFREKKETFEKKLVFFRELIDSLGKIVPFDSKQAEIAGEIRALLGMKGELIGDMDVLIAAASIASEAVLVTKNPKHFQRIKNLEVLAL